jgi:UDP-galactopyranose mutase
MSRFARNRRVFYVEEPRVETDSTRLEILQDETGVWIVLPFLSDQLSKEEGRAEHIRLINQLFAEKEIEAFITWYYTPMAMAYTRQLEPSLVVYDCMDELSAFNGAPQKMKDLEAELLQRADLVFTGGQSLFEAKRDRHPKVYAFPSSIDVAHFGQARTLQEEPPDQAGIPHPRLGFFGVIDERMDLDLIEQLAEARPDWSLVMVGPVAKLEPEDLPRQENIHYLGKKAYQELPAYLAGWDVALLPFALNNATRFISPTKTPEYLAGGKPVVSTPVRDVVRPYGSQGLVWIANTVVQYIRAVESALSLNGNLQGWLQQVDAFLSQMSWDRTWAEMSTLIEAELGKKAEMQGKEVSLQGGQYAESSVSLTALAMPYIAGKGQPKQMFDYLVVGAGYAGSVLAERLARGSGKQVLIIDRRPHVAGNAYDYYNESGLLVHKYGPHIFHTNSREVFDYLSNFTEWRPYEHRVLASVDGQLVPIPINLDTVNRLYGLHLSSFELQEFFDSVAEARPEIRTSEDVVVSKIGRQLYEKFFRNYTRKQWDLDPSELDASVTSRVPVRLNRDDRYFADTYQSMPLNGYTCMFENLLDHPNIKIMLNTDYREIVNFISFREMIFTGPVDEFFEYRFGKLPYRSIQFRFETLNEALHQPVAVINYPNEHLYTRSTEFKHLTGQQHAKTSLVYEYPCADGDPYYPIPRPENAEIYQKYKALADQTEGVYFAGRLATYKYYNMDQVTAQALTLYARIAGLQRSESALAFTPQRFTLEMPGSFELMKD